METALAILLALGIYIGIPAAIGFTIIGMVMISGRRAQRVERAKLVAEAEALAGQCNEVHDEAADEEETKVHITTA